MSQYIGLKASKQEAAFLEKVAQELNLTKSDGSPSIGKALKHVLQKTMYTYHDSEPSQLDNIEKLIEQINTSIPHITNASFVAAQAALATIDDALAIKIKSNAVDYIAETVGQIQSNKYRYIRIAYNHRNIITIPINKENNQWK